MGSGRAVPPRGRRPAVGADSTWIPRKDIQGLPARGRRRPRALLPVAGNAGLVAGRLPARARRRPRALLPPRRRARTGGVTHSKLCVEHDPLSRGPHRRRPAQAESDTARRRRGPAMRAGGAPRSRPGSRRAARARRAGLLRSRGICMRLTSEQAPLRRSADGRRAGGDPARVRGVPPCSLCGCGSELGRAFCATARPGVSDFYWVRRDNVRAAFCASLQTGWHSASNP